MRIILSVLFFSLLVISGSKAQVKWRATLERQDGNMIVFNFLLQQNEHQKSIIYIINNNEKIKVDNIKFIRDSVFIVMPVFESQFKAKVVNSKKWEGVWIKGGSIKDQIMPFIATQEDYLFSSNNEIPTQNITGRWSVQFTKPNGTKRPAIAEFVQKNTKLTGTFLTPTGDYRYLNGQVNGNKIQLTTFDGGHAFLFTATIDNQNKISEGKFFSGATSEEPWEAFKNDTATLPDLSAMYVKDGEEKLNFKFPDLDKKIISINDTRFKNKVVIVQIMGSWCPNCMDETAFLSDYYKKNKQKGIEVIALAYELSEDYNRSRASIKKFRDRFQVEYPMLVTGVTVNDSLRTEKTLPQLTPIKAFPTTIFIDKKGRVASINSGFYGPGSGEHYSIFKQEFETAVEKLLKE